MSWIVVFGIPYSFAVCSKCVTIEDELARASTMHEKTMWKQAKYYHMNYVRMERFAYHLRCFVQYPMLFPSSCSGRDHRSCMLYPCPTERQELLNLGMFSVLLQMDQTIKSMDSLTSVKLIKTLLRGSNSRWVGNHLSFGLL